jgi:hypothetical protein
MWIEGARGHKGRAHTSSTGGYSRCVPLFGEEPLAKCFSIAAKFNLSARFELQSDQEFIDAQSLRDAFLLGMTIPESGWLANPIA